MAERVIATASVADTNFTAIGIGDTIEAASQKALEAVDKRIDEAYGYSKGQKSLDLNRCLKSSVVLELDS